MQVARFLTKPAKQMLYRVVPRTLQYLKMERELRSAAVEVELRLLPRLCRKGGVAVDVGAHLGIYSHVMAKGSRWVYAFEPNPDLFRRLAAVAPRNVTVKALALSDKAGRATLRLPVAANGQATIENGNELDRFERNAIAELTVETCCLDDFGFEDVAVIKIDVEGHESAVLVGAIKTIDKNTPALIIEIEERHRPGALKVVADILAPYGYQGWFYFGGALKELPEFVASRHQNVANLSADGSSRTGLYINNFLFIPGGAAAASLPATVR